MAQLGIVLAGGSGTRLYPITKAVSKQLLPLYDKPIVYFPISVLMEAGIRDILIISTPQDIDGFKRLLGDGSAYGVKFSYAVQPKPEGLAQAFLIAEECGFAKAGEDEIAMVLGDNVFHGANFSQCLRHALKDSSMENTATVFGYYVNDPERYGVAEFGEDGRCISIEEKPVNPKSNYAVVGLYFYPKDVIEKAKQVKPSARGELEITTLNNMYLQEYRLKATKMPRGMAWFDTGTFDSLSEAASYIETIEKRQGLQIACLEEIGLKNRWIKKADVRESANVMKNSQYGKYLLKLTER